jgi:dihydrofolate reductase
MPYASAHWTRRTFMPSRVAMPSISFIVARSAPGHVIGCENKLPWHLRSDLTRFRKLTMGHVIVMGRKTHESIGRALPGRTTIVISRSLSSGRENTVWSLRETSLLWATSREDALFLADFLSIGKDMKDFFVIGGEEIFKIFSTLFYKVYLTEVFGEIQGDATFDSEFRYPFWQRTSVEEFPATEVDDYPSRFSIFEKRDKKTRYRIFPEFLTDAGSRKEWISRNLEKLTTKKVDQAGETMQLFPEEQT